MSTPTSGRGSMSQITLSHGDRTWPLEPQNVVVAGRSQDCEIVVSDSQASRHHAQFHRRGSAVVVEDLGSSNGTWVDGARITTPATLADGAAVRIGGRDGVPVTVSISRPSSAVRMPGAGTSVTDGTPPA